MNDAITTSSLSWSSLFLCYFLLLHTHDTAKAQSGSHGYVEHVEWPPFDGWYNNLAHPDWGAGETQLFRRVAPAYGDGVYEPSGQNRPNPINISQSVFNGSTGLGSPQNRTALLVFFGQQVVEEILDAQRPGCPPEYFNIKIPTGHPQYDINGMGGKEIPLLRSRYDMRTGLSPNVPRQQLNEISSFIDGTLTYGPNKAWADALRSYKFGLLAATNDSGKSGEYSDKYFPEENDLRLPMANPPPPRDHTLKPIRRFFKLGNPRGNENPFLLTFGVLWFRYHNYRARQLYESNPGWSDERLFNEARKWTIAVHQKIVVYDWLPSWLADGNNTDGGILGNYTGYDPTINPGIAHVFQSAAMRFGHTLVPPGVFRRDAACNFYKATAKTGPDSAGKEALRTCNTYWNPQEGVTEHDIDALLLGMASQVAEKEDMIITPDLRGNVFGPLEFSRRDLMAVNIQRGRDHGIPDYNTVRENYGLKRRTTWEEINPQLYADNPDIFNRLESVYNGDIDNLDLWPAGMMETTTDGPGETFRAIITDQFRRVRDGDRFWFENYKINKLYTEDEVNEIKQITIRDVILATTGIPDNATLQQNPFRASPEDFCQQPFQLTDENITHLEPCTEVKHYDYFSGSAGWFIFSFVALGAVIPLSILALFGVGKIHTYRVKKQMAAKREDQKRKSMPGFVTAVEWVGPKQGRRDVRILLNDTKKQIIIQNSRGKWLRNIDLKLLKAKDTSNSVDIIMSADNNMRMIMLRIPREYDLVLKFDSSKEKDDFYNMVKEFVTSNGMGVNSPRVMTERTMKSESYTKDKRQSILNSFFRTVFAHAFHYDVVSGEGPDKDVAKNVITCELTKHEFAEVLALKPESIFVENMFKMVDKDNNGYISFREFLDVIVLFSKGSSDDKAKLMFDMYDLDGSGSLTKDEFKLMLRSMMELANDKLEESKMDDLIQTMFRDIGLDSKQAINFSDFNKMLREYKDELSHADLKLNVDAPGLESAKKKHALRENGISRARKTILAAYKNERDENASTRNRRFSTIAEVKCVEKKLATSPFKQKLIQYKSQFETYRLHIFWATLYTLVVAGIFIERSYYYSVEREHAGLRRIAGYGVTVTRGAASAMMFTYSCLLVTMCRNLLTRLRETFLHIYIPFDAAIAFHKYIAYMALFFTVMHCVGHGINFYHISTQTADDLTCLFRNFFHATDVTPGFEYWLWETLTGFTGVLAAIVVVIMYVFATQYARRASFRAFWITHHLYMLLFILMILHGAGRLVQPPFFHYFFLGPAILFTFDKLISISRRKVEIQVLKADILPSEVTHLRFSKPPSFEYKSGQWCRIASIVQGENEYHPFTLTSAPHEEWLSLHIRAVGPWTMNLRKLYDPNNLKEHALPKIYLDGPYGEGHQDWYKYKVAVLVGGGIGVTPFASILKDIAHRSASMERIACKKVYFLWVTRTQKQFEWLTDIIREVEEKDQSNLVSVHIFITQFKEKFDVRTTMLYICERYFQKISHRSLFTGLRSITHFGRPDFADFFRLLQQEHSDTDTFGVFSCGPAPMTSTVDKSCNQVNKDSLNARFVHHFENF